MSLSDLTRAAPFSALLEVECDSLATRLVSAESPGDGSRDILRSNRKGSNIT